MAIVKPIPEQEDIDWRHHCAACQCTDNTIMVPQLNGFGNLVAYIMICRQCRKKMDHSIIEVVMKEDVPVMYHGNPFTPDDYGKGRP